MNRDVASHNVRYGWQEYGNSDTEPNPSLLKLRQPNVCHYA
jgi:hypothetical protein